MNVLRRLAAALLLGSLGLMAGCGSSVAVNGSSNTPLPPPTVTLTSISVTPLTDTLPLGVTGQFAATGVFSDGTKKDITATVTWTSASPNVATIDNTVGSSGIATPVTPGQTTLTATSGTIFATATLTVSAATLVSIGVTPAMPSVATGTQQQFTATGVYSDNSTRNLTAAVTWTSSSPGVAGISNAAGSAGLASAVAGGVTTIAAALNGVSGSTPLTVTGSRLASISIAPANASIAKGTAQALTATGTYADNSTQNLTAMVTWTSSNPAIASLASAAGGTENASAVSQGTVTLTASLGGVTGSTGLTVTAATLVSLAVTPAAPSIAKTTHQQFTATGTYTDGSVQTLTSAAAWSSSNTAVATVVTGAGQDGYATGVSAGTATITAAVGAVQGSAMLTVGPAPLASIAVTPMNPVTSIGGTVQFVATGTYADGTTQIITTSVTWTSSNTATATISNAAGSQGLATGAGVGTTQIIATDPTTGIISPPDTLTVANAFAFSADYTHALGGQGTVSPFQINPNGTLTAVSAPVNAGANSYWLLVDPANKYLYVGNYDQGNTPQPGSISQFTIAPNGALTLVTTVATPNGPNGGALNPNGHNLYVANYDADSVAQYSIGGAGLLTPMLQPTVPVGTGVNPASVAVNPAGTHAYVVTYNSISNVYQFDISALDGSLTANATPPVVAGKQSNSIVIDPSGRFAYVVNSGDGTISQYTIGTNGALMPMTPATVPAGAQPWSITVDASTKNAYVPNRAGDSITHYTIDTTTGALTMADVAAVAPGSGPTSLAIDPTGRFAYVADRGPPGSVSTMISQFTIGANGALTPLTPATVQAGANPATIITAR